LEPTDVSRRAAGFIPFLTRWAAIPIFRLTDAAAPPIFPETVFQRVFLAGFFFTMESAIIFEALLAGG
jgi:hypothetical protein